MKPNTNGIEIEGEYHPSCIKLTKAAIETINDLQAGGTLLSKQHHDEDFTDCGIKDYIRILSELQSFVFDIYDFKMSHLAGSEKDDFAFDLLEKMEEIEYIKDAFNSFRTKEKEDRFERKPLTK